MTRKNKRRLPRNVSAFVDRHGRERFRYRATGHPTRYFKEAFGTKEFEAELAAFREGGSVVAARYAYGTVGWLAARYRVSLAFTAGKNEQTERTAWAILEKFIAQVARDRIADFRFDHIEALLRQAAVKRVEKGRQRGGPHAARNLHGELLPFFRYAIKHGLITANPVELADVPAVPKGGFHTWTNDEIAQYRKRWAMGTKARLALEIFLWTAQRRGDASTFGRKHMKNGRIAFTPSKTKDSSGKTVWLPAAPQLVEAIEAMSVTGTETYLVTDFGNPFSKAGLGNKMREWCDSAGLPQCSAHGLRKAIARMAAEEGASNQELKALGGWTSDQQVSVYTAAVEQQRMAEQALRPVIDADLANRAAEVSQSK